MGVRFVQLLGDMIFRQRAKVMVGNNLTRIELYWVEEKVEWEYIILDACTAKERQLCNSGPGRADLRVTMDIIGDTVKGKLLEFDKITKTSKIRKVYRFTEGVRQP